MVNRKCIVDILGLMVNAASLRRQSASPRPAARSRQIRGAFDRNASTAISFAAFMIVVAPPPASIAARATRRAGNFSRIRRFERERRDLGKIKPLRRPFDTVRPGQAMRDRHPHVGRRQLRDHRAVAEFDQAVNDRLRVDQHVDLHPTATQTGDAPR